MKPALLILFCAAVGFAEPCWKKLPEGVRQEVACGEDSAKWVSDEKPPKDRMPSYQREGVKVVDAPTTGADDIKADVEKKDAEAKGIAACEKKFGKGQCGERGKEPK